MSDAKAPLATDALVVGAGPVGLFQVFELGLLEIGAHVVDSLPAAGGQCAELYGDKPIYDIPGLPYCTGRELAERLLRQIEPFGAGLHLGQEVTAVAANDDGGFDVQTSTGTAFRAGVVIIAAGVGAFQPRRLKLAGIEAFDGTQVLHRLPADATQFDGQQVVVVGGVDAALDAAVALSHRARVTLVHRRGELPAEPDCIARFEAARGRGELAFVAGQPTALVQRDGRLAAVSLATPAGDRDVALDTLLVLQGLSPRLGPIADWHLALERKQLVVDTERFQTSTPGIFAVGDIVTYPGKKKLIVCGFHEATMAAFAAAEHLRPGVAQPLQYTTTSPRLHALLGVSRA